MIEVTEADLRRFAPKARREYITAILAKLSVMQQAGLLESPLRWCHFIGQCGHETRGLTIIRESLTYTSAKRLREVWPARFRSKTDAELQPLLRNPERLGDAVYMGRMGNLLPGQGCAFRGAGLLQSTGLDACRKYASALGLDPSPALLDDVSVTTEFAILEWSQSGCNTHADANDIMAVSKAINVGSATSGVMPVGMDGRREWFATAWTIWGEEGKPDKTSPSVTARGMTKTWAPRLVVAGVGANEVVGAVKTVVSNGMPEVPPVATKSLENLSAWKAFGKSFFEAGREGIGALMMVGRLWPLLLIAGAAGGALAWLTYKRRPGHGETA